MTTAVTMGMAPGLAHAGNHSFAPGLAHLKRTGMEVDSYGFDGYAGNAMLAAGLTEARTQILLNLPQGTLIPAPFTVLPAIEGTPQQPAPDLWRSGTTQRAALARFELLSSVTFRMQNARAALVGCDASQAPQFLVEMSRPSLNTFKRELDDVRALASQRTQRVDEILTQVAPPMAYYATIANLQAGRHARTLELLDLAIEFANAVCMRFKHALACPRPSRYGADIQAMIEVPQHETFPCGHATEGFMIVGVLAALIGATGATDGRAVYLRRAAWRIAYNRVVAGLHFPNDNYAGRVLGDALASYFVGRCTGNHWTSAAYDGDTLQANLDEGQDDPALALGHGCTPGAQYSGLQSGILTQLWKAAQDELK